MTTLMLKHIACHIAVIVTLIVSARSEAQTSLPPTLDDLPKLAKGWPPAWQALVREIVPPGKEFEKDVQAKLDALMLKEPPTRETYPCAETVLAAALRHHQAVRRVAP